MKYYIMTYCYREDALDPNSFNSLTTLVVKNHPFLVLLEFQANSQNEDAHWSLVFYAEISKAEYDLFCAKSEEIRGI